MWQELQKTCGAMVGFLNTVGTDEWEVGEDGPWFAEELTKRFARALLLSLKYGESVGAKFDAETVRLLVEVGFPVATVAKWADVSRPTVYKLLKSEEK